MIEDMNEVSAALKRMQEEQARLDGNVQHCGRSY